MLSKRGLLQASLVIAQMMTTSLFLKRLHDDMTMRLEALVQLHMHRR